MRLRAERICVAHLIWALPSPGMLTAGEGGHELVLSSYFGGKSVSPPPADKIPPRPTTVVEHFRLQREAAP